MLFVSLSQLKLFEALQDPHLGVELRLDLFPILELNKIKDFLLSSPYPVMLTLRSRAHGGNFKGNCHEQQMLIKQLLTLEPSFFDLEYDLTVEFISSCIHEFPKTQFILSYHNYADTPSNSDLEKIYQQMQSYPAYQYKIATLCLSTNDALRMLLFGQNHPKTSVICMGEKGSFARVLAPIFKSSIGFAHLDTTHQTAPGQLTAQELIDIYHYPHLNQQTAIYGLIGDPVRQSPGHHYHNASFTEKNLNAVYVKMVVEPEELPTFISLAKAIGISGLSVTIPLKEKILPFIDDIDPIAKEMGAVNTLAFHKNLIFGTNTDGAGALDVIEQKITTSTIQGKKIVILGAGGAAHAIAFEAKSRGAQVIILNRTVERAQHLAERFHCSWRDLNEIPSDYDILINCLSASAPVDISIFPSDALIMDVNYNSPLLKIASIKGCKVVYGEEMFINQAIKQLDYWMQICGKQHFLPPNSL